ncbi:hypothetical protein HOE37_02720 [Candidatus Woesearchaeota archaeon]|jgi:hypothetical protein|nr:hypothetical protein [Candidatus Woesearchaeota archaeon]MBT4110741.1 hypothetical protein [Candidatus Woesearchaeota archaeon]MBT4336337.1 hypothetical protein [Candidatus Woesearchaeota archaeon]MBT4469302.1 hypothetical protein [Candidatus Woesearchaeota archaeon]MBT6743875.1 hypothetical protein [Candidatus Woesearchaeota archaeon]
MVLLKPTDLNDSQDLVRLIGFFLARKGKAKDNHFGAAARELDVVENALALILRNFDCDISISSYADNLFRFRFYNDDLQETYNHYTKEGTSLPWELFSSTGDQEELFKWYFSRVGSVAVEEQSAGANIRTRFIFRNSPNLGEDFAVLLFNLGMLPYHSVTGVEICDHSDLIKAKELCFNARKKVFLEDLLKTVSNKTEMPPQMVLSVIDQVNSGIISRKEGQEILKDYNVPVTRLDQWRFMGTRPNNVKRYLHLKELKETVYERNEVIKLRGYVPITQIFNMYLSERYLSDDSVVKACHSQYLVAVRNASIDIIEIGSSSYVAKEVQRDIGEILEKKLFCHKERTFDEAKELTEKLGS